MIRWSVTVYGADNELLEIQVQNQYSCGMMKLGFRQIFRARGCYRNREVMG